MRMYTDSADAIKAYAEEVNFDLSKCDEVIEIKESEKSRGGLQIKFPNYNNKLMTVTIHHTWGDLFDITFHTSDKGEQTINDVFFDDLMATFNALKVAMTGVTKEEWRDILFNEGE
jgi:hypothetical protein